MGLRFVGGPFDGMEIDHTAINKHAKLAPVEGDLGRRLFILMPDSREDWEKMVKGEEFDPTTLLPYEREFAVDGPRFVATPIGSFERALSQAKLKVHPRALIALAALSLEDSRRVIEAADALQHAHQTVWPRDRILRISDDKPDYLLRVTPELRAFVRVADNGAIELIDIAREDTLRLFLERYREVAVPK